MVDVVQCLVGMSDLDASDLVLRRLGSFAPLSALDAERVFALPLVPHASPAGAELCAAGVAGLRPRFLVQGWACRLRVLPDGRCQIFNLVLPGDLIGSCLRPHQPAAAATVALTRVETASAAGFAALLGAAAPQPGVPAASPSLASRPSLAAACAALERQGEALLLDQITRLGRQSAYERTAHLFLEIWGRLAVVGLAAGNTFRWPLRQDTMADLLGLSVVHVNRTLQQLRRERVLELRAGVAVLLQPERLRAAADVPPPLPKAG